MLIPSTRHARRTRAYISTRYIPPPSSQSNPDRRLYAVPFWSATAGSTGRFSGGLLRRRSHCPPRAFRSQSPWAPPSRASGHRGASASRTLPSQYHCRHSCACHRDGDGAGGHSLRIKRTSASPHDRRTCNRPETGTRLSLSPSWSPPSSNGLIETSRRGGESRSLALVPAARKAPASFSPWRAGVSRGLRACCVISTLVGRSQDRRPGLPRLRF